MAAGDANPIPLKGQALRITFPIRDADGDLVTGAADLDSEISKDGAEFADCANEATEIATSSGVYYLDLTSTEMNADTVAVITKTSTVGAKTACTILYPGYIPWNADWDAEVQSEVQDAIEVNALDHLMAAAVTGTDCVDNSVFAKLVSKTYGTADWDNFDNTTDSLQAIRDQGDAAWLTGAGAAADKYYTTTTWARTVGDNDGGAAADTATVNGQLFSTGETTSGNLLEVDATFTVSAGEFAVSLDVWGYYVGSGSHAMIVQAKDSVANVYEPIGRIGLGSTVEFHTFALAPQHTNTSNQQVLIKFLHTSGSGVASHVFHIDKAQVNARTNPSTGDMADAIHDEVVEGSLTMRQILRLLLAVMAGKTTGGGTTSLTFRDAADAKARVSATVDSSGNRTAITLDGA